MRWLHALGHALAISGSMTWEILWALILGFALSAVVQAVVRRSTIIRRLGDDRPRTLATATGFGAASSSCSYAAVALARSLFRLFLRQRLLEAARTQADKGLAGSMEGHAAMDMTIPAGGSLWQRLRTRQAFTSVSHVFVMEWAAVIRDIVIGLLIAGAVAAWVPDSFWGHLFLTGHPLASKLWGPLIGPVVSLLSFVCSIGNVPLAAVLWNGGISFGGVVAFIFADLIIVPILVIYRKYYGTKMMLFILAAFYATMAAAGYLTELIFGTLGLIPAGRHATVTEASVQWNYTTVLNIIFLILAAALCYRFTRTGGIPMLKMMGGQPGTAGDHDHHAHTGH